MRAFSITVAMLVLAWGMPALADRAGKWEATVQIVSNSSESANGENGSSIDVDSDIGFAFGGAYNLSEHFAVGVDLSFLSPDYDATLVQDGGGRVNVGTDLDIFNGQIQGTWNILKGPITPYVQVGMGWTYVDSNIVDGLPETGCWWDPWWGYVCANFYDTYDDTSFSYGVGAGMRFEFDNGMFFKGSYNRLQLDAGGDGSDPTFDLWRLELGWMIR